MGSRTNSTRRNSAGPCPLSAAQQTLAADNRRLAFKLAHQLHRCSGYRDLPLEDLESEALLALCRSARSYDPTRGIAFSTYVYTAVHRSLARLLSRTLEVRGRELLASDIAPSSVSSVGGDASQYGWDLLVSDRDAEDPLVLVEAHLDLKTLLDRAARRVPAHLWPFLRDYYLLGLTYKALGLRYGMSRTEAGNRVREALAHAQGEASLAAWREYQQRLNRLAKGRQQGRKSSLRDRKRKQERKRQPWLF